MKRISLELLVNFFTQKKLFLSCILLLSLSMMGLTSHASAKENIDTPVTFSDSVLNKLGHKLWDPTNFFNDPNAIASWNHYPDAPTEDFTYMGLPECIWYTPMTPDKFQEDWPAMAQFLKKKGYPIEDWMVGPYSPWQNKEELADALTNPENPYFASLRALRDRLATEQGITDQTAWIVQRFNNAYPQIFEAAKADQLESKVIDNFNALRESQKGTLAMIDYVHFKGEGLKPEESYQGEGWGLLQVLETMDPARITQAGAVTAFIDAAETVLLDRKKNSDPAKNEGQYMSFWMTHMESYQNLDL